MQPFRTLIQPDRTIDDVEPFTEDELTGPTKSTRIWVADVNGDGNIDLITDDQIGRTLVVVYGKGDGTFPYAIASDAAPIPISALFA